MDTANLDGETNLKIQQANPRTTGFYKNPTRDNLQDICKVRLPSPQASCHRATASCYPVIVLSCHRAFVPALHSDTGCVVSQLSMIQTEGPAKNLEELKGQLDFEKGVSERLNIKNFLLRGGCPMHASHRGPGHSRVPFACFWHLLPGCHPGL